MDIAPTLTGTGSQPSPQRRDAMMREARALEASFLAEMLGHAGLGAPSDSFGGGHGEEQFASFLKQEQARLMVERGGIGLAEMIFKTMAGAEAKDAG
jgi:peptidoglycan hydrolase FlgJ